MEMPYIKFAIQSPDDTLSSTADAPIRQITPGWVRFTAPESLLEHIGIGLTDTLSEENRVAMLVYLDPALPPIRAIGRVAWCERSPKTHEEALGVVVQFVEISVEDQDVIQKHIQTRSPGVVAQEARSGQPRRQSDLFFQEIARMVETLANMAEGRQVSAGEQFARLLGVKNALGRRLEDKQLGDAVCYQIERLASNVARLLGTGSGLRKVRIRKVTGKEQASVAKDKVFVGWEEAPPTVGGTYCLYIEGGGIFRSTTVTQVLKDHFRTRNSLYEIQEA